MSLGDLCHTKASLRLPLKQFPSTLEPLNISDKTMLTSVKIDDLPTSESALPTLSMDSISTSSITSGDKPLSFSTFGKSWDSAVPPADSTPDNLINSIDSDANLTSPHDRESNHLDNDIVDVRIAANPIETKTVKSNSKKLNDHRNTTRQSDSTDEDSGIESIMRIAKEIA